MERSYSVILLKFYSHSPGAHRTQDSGLRSAYGSAFGSVELTNRLIMFNNNQPIGCGPSAIELWDASQP